jgi:PAS domain S-box-containing protein
MALKTFGYKQKEDMLGVDISKHYWFAEDRSRILSALKQQSFLHGIEVCMKRTDGEPFWILYNLALLSNSHTGQPEIIGTAMDISGMKKTQKDLHFAKEAAEGANRAKDQFLANMSHELRTPLNGIMGMTTLALYGDLPSEVRGHLEDVTMSANELLRIINDVLDYSKIEADQLTLQHERFSPRKTLDDSIRTLAASAELKQICLSCKIATDLPEFVWGDSGRLRQILLNLLGNAIKFTDSGEVVMTVEANPAGKQQVALHVKISDTGVGIPSDKLRSIFDAFVQADSSDTRRFGGTGLGLAISRQLATAMKGKVWAESTLGTGSTFHLLVDLTLPTVMEDALVDNDPNLVRT